MNALPGKDPSENTNIAADQRAVLRERLLASAPSEKKMREAILNVLMTRWAVQENIFATGSDWSAKSNALSLAREAHRVAAGLAQVSGTELQKLWLDTVCHF